VSISLAPQASGKKSLQVSETGFSYNETSLPAIQTESFSSVVGAVVGSAVQEVSALTTSATSAYSFKFTNRSSSTITGLQAVTVSGTSGSPGSLTGVTPSTLAPAASFTVSGTYTRTAGVTSGATPNGSVTATLNYTGGVATATSNGGGRMVGYLEGWNTPPSADSSSAAGYTHVMVAFGVFSTTNPGEIVPVFTGFDASYIKSLQALGIKVLLSIGGASTNTPNTTVNFHDILTAASSPSAFQTTFLASMASLAVAFATDLLASWPSTCPGGQASGFQTYTSYLAPSQVVLGYPAVNGSGISDGSPSAVVSVVQRAVQCLRTGVQGSGSCDTYVAPAVYANLGGVFSWQINNDASNDYQFSTSLYPCVVNETCS